MDLLALGVAIFALGLRIWLAAALDLDGDEAYYALWANWLSPGYLDHPPGVALFIAAGEALLGTSVPGVRLLPLVGSAVTLLALHRTTRLLVPFPAAPALAVIWYSFTLTALIGFVATPDAPSVLFWSLSVWAAAEAVTRGRPNWWLGVGLFAGLGLVGKYTNAWLGVGLVLYLLATPTGRQHLRAWQLWAGGALAIVVFAPVLWWNAQHDWQSFVFQGRRVVTFKHAFGRDLVEFLAGQVLAVGPVLLLASLAGMIWFARGRAQKTGAALALPVLTSLPALTYFFWHSLHSRVEVNWTQPLLAPLTLVAAALLAAPQLGRANVLGRRLANGLHLGLGAVAIALVCLQALIQPFDLGIADRSRMLRDWREMAADVRALADANAAQAIWVDVNYAVAGELFFYSKLAGDPRPVRDLRDPERYTFIPADLRYPEGTPALLVDRVAAPENPPPPTNYFVETHFLDIVTRGAGRTIEYYAVWLVSGPTPAVPSAE